MRSLQARIPIEILRLREASLFRGIQSWRQAQRREEGTEACPGGENQGGGKEGRNDADEPRPVGSPNQNGLGSMKLEGHSKLKNKTGHKRGKKRP